MLTSARGRIVMRPYKFYPTRCDLVGDGFPVPLENYHSDGRAQRPLSDKLYPTRYTTPSHKKRPGRTALPGLLFVYVFT